MRIVGAYETQGLNPAEIAEIFQVCDKTVRRLIAKSAKRESLAPGFAPGPAPKLGDKELGWLRRQLESNPYLTSYELAAGYNKRFLANRVHRSTILRAMHSLGFTHKKRPR